MKKAIVVVSFGTSYKETRDKNIQPCEEMIAAEFKGYDFYRAFTSNMIIKKVAVEEKIHIPNPIQILDQLVADGYEEVVVQTLHIICGEEYCKLREQVASYQDKFKKIILGRPLLSKIDDYKKAIEAVKKQLPALGEKEAVVFMGHGTDHEAHSAYCAVDYMFDQEDLPVFVGTVEGYPELEEVIKRLKRTEIRKVYLMPFMLVAGDHATNDMAGDEEDSWKVILEQEGYEVECMLVGLGENPAIRERFLIHIKEAVAQA